MFKRQAGKGLSNGSKLALLYKLLQQVVKPARHIRCGQTPPGAVIYQHTHIRQQPHHTARSQAIKYSHRNFADRVFPQPFQNLMRSLLGLRGFVGRHLQHHGAGLGVKTLRAQLLPGLWPLNGRKPEHLHWHLGVKQI